jgi:osmotically-inducible protein OsmY
MEVIMNDLTLRQSIIDELEFEPSVDAAHIGVSVDGGVVTLNGHVTSYAEKIAAERAVQRIKGVRAIAEEIEVRYPEAKKSSDDEIAKRALAILDWDMTIPHDKIQLKVQRGWVTLSGQVDWYYQKLAAETAVRKLSGVVGVNNTIVIRPRVDAANIKHRIEDALKRNAEVEAKDINVGVAGGKVTLEGKVHAWHERGVVERAAWSVPGVASVEDKLMIG